MEEVVEALDRLSETIKVASVMIIWSILMHALWPYAYGTIVRILYIWRNKKRECSRDGKRSM